jgi:hypothetical protein
MKMMRVHVALWFILLIGGFLLGFIPEYRKNRDLRTQLGGPQRVIDALKIQIQLGELRDAAGLMFLELSRQNYGLARDHANDYYNKLRELISESQDETLKKSLGELSATQESLMSSLVTPTPAALTAAQAIVLRTVDVTKSVGGK